jgi:hypothetical protein
MLFVYPKYSYPISQCRNEAFTMTPGSVSRIFGHSLPLVRPKFRLLVVQDGKTMLAFAVGERGRLPPIHPNR